MYSMTKPIVAVALMMLYEEGHFLLSDPAHLFLGDAWKKKNMHVYGEADDEADGERWQCPRASHPHNDCNCARDHMMCFGCSVRAAFTKPVGQMSLWQLSIIGFVMRVNHF